MPSRPVFFVKIEKTGSTSISYYFGKQISMIGTKKALEMREQHGKNAYIFTFVRHPMDRLISIYSFIVSGMPGGKVSDTKKKFFDLFLKRGKDKKGNPTPKGFMRFCESFFSEFPTPDLVMGDNRSASCPSKSSMIWPQHVWLPKALKPNYIAHFELLQQELNTLCKRAKLNPAEKLRTSKKSTSWLISTWKT
jgi:hypothetical protein